MIPVVFHKALDLLLLSLGNYYGFPGIVGPVPIRQDNPRLQGVPAHGFFVPKPGH